MNFDLKDSKTQIMLILIIVIAGAWYGFVSYILSPEKEVIAEKEKELSELQNKYYMAKRVADRLPDAEKELERLQQQWNEAQKQLPNQKQIEDLLVQLTSMGVNRGVDFQKFTPEPERPPKGFYKENVISISVKADYHDLASFFSDIANLERIVKVDKVNISTSRGREDDNSIEANFQAIAYAFVEQAGGVPSASEK